MDPMRAAYDELYAYTLEHGGPSFILQHVVDAYGAQMAAAGDKPIRLVFSLAGLCLHVERQFTGRQVQRVHMRMGQHKREWPRVPLPSDRGNMTAADVVAVPPGADRDRAIDAWCETVWRAFSGSRQQVVDLLSEYGVD
jgi:hypothetical protein